MEIMFECQERTCLRALSCPEQTLEKIQDISVEEPKPSPRRVLGCWGQAILRGKQWHGKNAAVSGGVQVWVLYEGDSGKQCVLTDWIPFEGKWMLEDREEEGVLHCELYIHSLEARCTASGRIQVRTAVTMVPKVMYRDIVQICTPEELPKGIRIKQKNYPVFLPAEAGEHTFDIEEILDFPNAFPACQELVYGSVQPEIREYKVMGDKIVFRGCCQLHVLCKTAERGILCQDFEIPFSRYHELDKAYPEESRTDLSLCVTNLELSCSDEGRVQLQMGAVVQYTVFQEENIACMEDALSITHNISCKREILNLPVLLDQRKVRLDAQIHPCLEGTRFLDAVFYPQPLTVSPDAAEYCVTAKGYFRVLFYDMSGELAWEVCPWEEQQSLPADPHCVLSGRLNCQGSASARFTSGGAEAETELSLDISAGGLQDFSVVTGLELGEPLVRDPDRPSVLLCKRGKAELWNLAKQYGTTVEDICEANGLEGEPEEDRMLLIPIP